jgi:hypothetical protein
MTADLSSAEPGDVALVALPISGIVDASGLHRIVDRLMEGV